MDIIIQAITDFLMREYFEDPTPDTFDNPSRVWIGYTYAEDREDIEINVAVNMVDVTIDMYINGKHTDTWQYDNAAALAYEIERISFDELMALGPNAERMI